MEGADLLAASRQQRTVDCGGAEVDAAEIRRACLAAGDADPYGLRLANARVTGLLDLRALDIPVPLQFASCDFADPVTVEGAKLHELVIADERPLGHPARRRCVLRGLLGNGVRIAHDLILSGMVVTGALAARASVNRSAVWLTEAEIGGRFLAAGTVIDAAGGRAVHGDRSRIGGDVRFVHGFRTTGEVRMLAVQLDGSLDLTGAQLLPADGRAVDLAEAAIGGSVFLLDSRYTGGRCRVLGRVEMGHTTIQGKLFARHAELTAPPAGAGQRSYDVTTGGQRPFLLAPGLTVRGGVLLEGDTVVRGGLFLPGAQLDGGLRLDGAVWNPGDVAVDLTQATVGGVRAVGASIEGEVDLSHARVEGPVDLGSSTLAKAPEGRCLTAANCRVAGDVRLTGLAVLGGRVHFRGAVIEGMFDAAGAFVTNPGDRTIALHMAHITGNVRMCDGFRSVGVVNMARVVVDGRLRADSATLEWRPGEGKPHEHNPRGFTFAAPYAEIRGGVDLAWTVTGAVDFANATTTSVADRPDRDWPVASYLGGFRYTQFTPAAGQDHAVWEPAARIAWLSRLRPYEPRAWEQLAVVLRTAGDHAGADAVLIAQRRHARRLGLTRRRLFDQLMDVTVRYGFRPQRALFLLVALVALVTATLSLPAAGAQMRASDQNALVFTPAGAQPLPGEPRPGGTCGNGKVRCLNPFFYAVDTVVPLIDLHQRSTWYPSDAAGGRLLEWWLNLCTILGWLASTVFALSFTRLGRAS